MKNGGDLISQLRVLFCAFCFMGFSCATQSSLTISTISSFIRCEANSGKGEGWNVTARNRGMVIVKVDITASGDYGQTANNGTSLAAFLKCAIWGSSKPTLSGSRAGKGEKA